MKNPWHSVRAAVAFYRVVQNPKRTDEVIHFMNHFLAAKGSAVTQEQVVGAFRDQPEGAKALRDRPRLGRISLDELAKYPVGSLGYEFAAHMKRNNLDLETLPVLPASNDKEYVIAHLHETHDVWHVITHFAPDGPGELGIQACYLAQFPSRLAISILSMGFANCLLHALDEYPDRMNAIVRGWTMGRRARSMLGVDWKTMFDVPLTEVRARFNVNVEPTGIEVPPGGGHLHDLAAAVAQN